MKKIKFGLVCVCLIISSGISANSTTNNQDFSGYSGVCIAIGVDGKPYNICDPYSEYFDKTSSPICEGYIKYYGACKEYKPVLPSPFNPVIIN